MSPLVCWNSIPSSLLYLQHVFSCFCCQRNRVPSTLLHQISSFWCRETVHHQYCYCASPFCFHTCWGHIRTREAAHPHCQNSDLLSPGLQTTLKKEIWPRVWDLENTYPHKGFRKQKLQGPDLLGEHLGHLNHSNCSQTRKSASNQTSYNTGCFWTCNMLTSQKAPLLTWCLRPRGYLIHTRGLPSSSSSFLFLASFSRFFCSSRSALVIRVMRVWPVC